MDIPYIATVNKEVETVESLPISTRFLSLAQQQESNPTIALSQVSEIPEKPTRKATGFYDSRWPFLRTWLGVLTMVLWSGLTQWFNVLNGFCFCKAVDANIREVIYSTVNQRINQAPIVLSQVFKT